LKKYPLLIFLHGYTDTTTWDLGWYHGPILSADPCIVLTPKCPVEEKKGWGSSWNQKPSPMMAKAFEMMGLVGQALSLDSSRFYICGSSMGGFGTFAAIQQHPDLFAAAYVECANGNTDMAGTLVNIPLWMFHGSNDSVVRVKGARDMYEAVIKAGGSQIKYTEYPGVGHNVWDYTRNETTLPYWLLAQRKGSTHNPPDSLVDLKAAVSGPQRVLLTWDLPAERPDPDKQVWYSRIYRDGEVISEVYNNGQCYTDTTAVAGKACLYQVSVVNYYFRESALSPAVTVVPGKK
jgi:dienelactone hydrolase